MNGRGRGCVEVRVQGRVRGRVRAGQVRVSRDTRHGVWVGAWHECVRVSVPLQQAEVGCGGWRAGDMARGRIRVGNSDTLHRKGKDIRPGTGAG